jgi:PAS domain S-box-containing protein
VEQKNTADTIKRLQSCISDLISVLSFPALWTGNEPSQIINTLLDGLVGMLRLDFAYARLSNGPPVEILCLAQRQPALTPAKEIGQALNPWLTGTPQRPPIPIPNPIGTGQVLIAPFRLGFQDEIGVVVAASKRQDFPTQIESLLLRVAANQAAIALQEARLLSEQKRTAQQLEQKVAERGSQLKALNLELLGEITGRDRAEEEQQKLAALVENSTDFIGVSSLDGRVLFLNPAGQRMVGLEGAQIRETAILDYVVEQERERFQQEILPSALHDGRWEGEFQLRHFKTGAAIPMLHHLFFIKEQGTDRRTALATISRDITARKRAEKTLLESERKFSVMFDKAAFAVSLARLSDGLIVDVNEAWSDIYGFRRDEAVGKTSIELRIHRDPRERELFYSELEQRGSVRNREITFFTKAGAARLISCNTDVVALAGNEYLLSTMHDITESKLAEEELREANETVATILNSITDQFFGLSRDWRFTYLSKYAADQMRQLGKDPESLIGKVLWDEFSEVPNETALRRVMSERVMVTDEFYYAPLGEWVENHMYPSRDGGLVTFQRYVTKRKQTEEELAALRDELANDLSTMISLHEFSTRFLEKVELQPLLEEVLDATIALQNADFGNVQLYDSETKGLRIVAQRGFQQDFLDYFSHVHEDSAACGRALQNQQRIIIQDVQTDPRFAPHRQIAAAAGYRAVQSTPLLSRSGEPLGMLSTHFRQPHRPSERDLRLTDLYVRQAVGMIERNRAEEKLRRSQAYLTEGQKISHTGSWAWNVTTGDLFWSEEHYRIFGIDPEKFKLTIEAAQQFIHPEDFPAALQTFTQATIAGREFDWKFRIIRPDGTVRYVNSQAHPVFSEAGELTEYVGTIIDTTQQKLSEEALRQAHAELAHASRVLTLGELTSSIAHEVNQPLGAIVTNGNASLRLLSRETPDLEGTREAVDCMISDAMRASEVIKGIRALLKKTTPQKARLDINEVIREVIALSAGELAKNQVSFRSELAADLQPVFGDRVQLQQVLLNLILNGNEAISKSTWLPRELVISSRPSGLAEVTVAVSDTGVGLDPKNQERVFDSFFTNKEGGLGLGLSISRTIIEAHNGKLWCTPNDGKGATFQFVLPSGDRS